MANPSSPIASAGRNRGEAMKKGQPLGLDELMIVNPSSSGTGALFLGEDGTFYQVQGLGKEAESPGTGEFFLGEDGTLYKVQGLGSNGTAEETTVASLDEAGGRELGRYFLGADGTLYEAVAK